MNSERNYSESRRKLFTLLAATGVLTASRAVPNQWLKPVVDSVVLPAHAQTSGAVTFTQSQSSGSLCDGDFNDQPADDAVLNFNWAGLTPVGDGTLDATATGDVNGDNDDQEYWTIVFNGVTLGIVGEDSPVPGGLPEPETRTASFTIPLATLLAAAGSAVVNANNNGNVGCLEDPDIDNTVDATLSFPAI